MLANAEESIHVPTARAQSKCHQQCKNQMKTNPYLMFQVPVLWKVSKNRHYCQLWVYAAYIASSARAALHAEKHRCALRYLRPAARPGKRRARLAHWLIAQGSHPPAARRYRTAWSNTLHKLFQPPERACQASACWELKGTALHCT